MKKIFAISLLLLFIFLSSVAHSDPSSGSPLARRPVSSLLGETLSYNVSFLWFNKIARGEIKLEKGAEAGTFLATLSAKTRGMTAFFSSNRVEVYTTLMEEGPDGLLRPLIQTSDTQKEKGGQTTHRITSYTFDFTAQNVTYRKKINGKEQQNTLYPMETNQPAYDFLSAFYNLRLGRLGHIEVGSDIKLAAFSHKGPEEILISRLTLTEQKKLEFADELLLCKVLMAPETFKTKARDVYVGFDLQLRPQLAVVKDVIGLGDVRGVLTHVVEPHLSN